MPRLPLARWVGCRKRLLNLLMSRQFELVGTGPSKILSHVTNMDCLKDSPSTSACHDRYIVQVCGAIGHKKKVVSLGTGQAGNKNKVRRGECVCNDEILRFVKLFNDELTLDNMSRPRLVNMCKYMGIRPFGTDHYLRFMLSKKLQDIKNDDKMIQAEGVESLSEEELRQACQEHGHLGVLSTEETRHQLCDWLDLSLNHGVPSSLLTLSRAFTVSGKVKPEEAVVAILSSLPDEVVDTVGTVLPSEDSVSERGKLEFLEMQELIKTISLPEKLKPGDWVGVKKDTLPSEYDSRVKAMEVDEKHTEDYNDIRGLEVYDKEVEGAQNIRNNVLKCFERSSIPDLSQDDHIHTVMFECPTVSDKYVMKQVCQDNYSRSPNRLGTCMHSKGAITRSAIGNPKPMPLLKPSGFTLLNKKGTCPIPMGSKVLLRLYSSNNKQETQDDGTSEDCKAEPFHIGVEPGNIALLKQKIDEAAQFGNSYNLESLKARYLKSDKQELLSKGLTAPGAIDAASTHHLHHRTRDLTKRSPIYLSSVDVIELKIRLGEEQWNEFVKHMIKERVYVIEDWKNSLGKVESLLYDHGIIGPDDGTDEDFYKAECDAAFKDKKATLSFIIWKGRRIMHSQVFEEVDCHSSVIAEVYAAIAVMAVAKQVGIKKLVLCSDSTMVKTILSGEYFIKHEDERRPVFLQLRFMAASFCKFVVQFKPRQLMIFVDDLTRMDVISDPLFFSEKVETKWNHHLKGRPVFRVTQEPNLEKHVIQKFVNDKSYVHTGLEFVLEVQSLADKFDNMMNVKEGLNPRDLSVVVHRYEQKPIELKSRFEEHFVVEDTYQEEECTLFSFRGNLKDMNANVSDAKGSLMVVFDAYVPRSIFCQKGHFIVVLASPEEKATMDMTGFENFSALSYISFRKLG